VQPHLHGGEAADLAPFLNPQTSLVPVPRSAPLAEGALWPAQVIAGVLQRSGFGAEVLPCIRRATAVRKSSSSPAKDRPSVDEHLESFAMNRELSNPADITLVDDVLTQGRTMAACALMLHDAFPDAQIRCFAMIRTLGFVDNIEKVLDPSTGVIHYYANSGKTFREP